jgi:uncharacterized protein with HEPN domain
MIATRNPLIRLKHIRDEIDAITASLRGIDRGRYAGDYLMRRGAERALLIISEAAKSLPTELLQRNRDVDWSEIVGLGNILRHDYHMVDDDTIWEILTINLPELSPVVDRMIRELTS